MKIACPDILVEDALELCSRYKLPIDLVNHYTNGEIILEADTEEAAKLFISLFKGEFGSKWDYTDCWDFEYVDSKDIYHIYLIRSNFDVIVFRGLIAWTTLEPIVSEDDIESLVEGLGKSYLEICRKAGFTEPPKKLSKYLHFAGFSGLDRSKFLRIGIECDNEESSKAFLSAWGDYFNDKSSYDSLPVKYNTLSNVLGTPLLNLGMMKKMLDGWIRVEGKW